MSAPARTLSLAHLSLVDVPPPRLVEIAAEAGFDAVGLRLWPARDDEARWPLLGDTAMARETRALLRATGLGVVDVEVLRLTPTPDLDAYARVLAAAAELGARFAVVSGFDPDEQRLTANYARLCELAAPLGVRPLLEPMAYSAVCSLAQAAQIATAAEAAPAPSAPAAPRVGATVGGVLVDAIHLSRTGGTLADVEALDPRLQGYMQWSDAPAALPPGLDAIAAESRTARLAPGEGALPLLGLLATLPADAPISVEVPDDAARARLGDLGHARHLQAAATALLASR
ncbi:TIM barrel protein [Conexibacter sp. JD483]|uniref:sugar phosphate isomerase/epimerase family protein n=1 Tax=unclassified Conexibacter TaxID=2627773 RepID=UPI00271C2202|nr:MULTISPECIES: TIM barrel protein [unclassified Conexibacter]MDO8186512.1 TIM barrel protein [Conexibacter sp. CPCC 205706]MDO8200081.1 TIM barrel protein [Conexibacter sp. CPCC 205762]MDR9372212.1 TIM barrel protein [Conexibacter sp. JD483]